MFNANEFEQFFLGANTADGFCSHFADNFNADEGWKAYILKGGPGTGKSTLLKKAVLALKDKGESVTVCPCSSDPNSLDAVIVQGKKLIILDGTAPHVVEPTYPGVCEQIVNLGEAFKRDGFNQNEKTIIDLCRKNKTLHAYAARYICAAGKLLNNSFLTALNFCDTPKCEAFAENLAKRHITNLKNQNGRAWYRYLMSPSCGKTLFFSDTIKKYNKVITVSDEYFAASSVILQRISAIAVQLGHQIICCENPFITGVIDHVLIPKLSLAFCVKNSFYNITLNKRTVHAERFYNIEVLRKNKNKLNFAKKSANILTQHATSLIKEAKILHDQIEEYYIKAMDYNKLDIIVNNFLENLS